MSESKQNLSHRELEELSAVGAVGAAGALGLILRRDVSAGAPRSFAGESYRPGDEWPTGVIFEAEGSVAGLVAILFPATSRSELGALDPREGHDEAIGSAMPEMGNIVASHMVSAIADELRGSILLSIPRLVMDGADCALAALVGERLAPRCFESDLFDGEGRAVACVVFVPDCDMAGVGA